MSETDTGPVSCIRIPFTTTRTQTQRCTDQNGPSLHRFRIDVCVVYSVPKSCHGGENGTVTRVTRLDPPKTKSPVVDRVFLSNDAESALNSGCRRCSRTSTVEDPPHPKKERQECELVPLESTRHQQHDVPRWEWWCGLHRWSDHMVIQELDKKSIQTNRDNLSGCTLTHH